MKYQSLLISILFILVSTTEARAGLRVIGNISSDITLNESDDLHITAATEAIAEGVTVDLADSGCRLF